MCIRDSARSARHVVQDDRDLSRPRHRAEMFDQPAGGGFIVVGGDMKSAIGTGLFGSAREGHGFGGGIGSRAGQNLYPFARELDHQFNHPPMFRVGERGGFARGSARHEGRSSPLDLKFHQFRQLLFVNRAVQKRRHKRYR